jgi:DNA mismatch endonuclease (patch repair protein)
MVTGDKKSIPCRARFFAGILWEGCIPDAGKRFTLPVRGGVMADVHSKETRSYNMSRIRSRNTKPEMLVRRYLHAQGFRYKLHDKTLPGKPDIVLPKYKTVIFIHGCFWHGHENCKYYVVPKTKTEWWLNKINGNIANDEKAITALQHPR